MGPIVVSVRGRLSANVCPPSLHDLPPLIEERDPAEGRLDGIDNDVAEREPRKVVAHPGFDAPVPEAPSLQGLRPESRRCGCSRVLSAA